MSANAQQSERESSSMRSNYEASQGSVKSLEEKVSSLEASLREAIDKVEKSEQEQARLSNEKTALVAMVKKLNRDVAKLETFKRTLMQQLQDENDDEPPSMVSNRIRCSFLCLTPDVFYLSVPFPHPTPHLLHPYVSLLLPLITLTRPFLLLLLTPTFPSPPSFNLTHRFLLPYSQAAATAAAPKPAASEPTTASAGSGASAAKQAGDSASVCSSAICCSSLPPSLHAPDQLDADSNAGDKAKPANQTPTPAAAETTPRPPSIAIPTSSNMGSSRQHQSTRMLTSCHLILYPFCISAPRPPSIAIPTGSNMGSSKQRTPLMTPSLVSPQYTPSATPPHSASGAPREGVMVGDIPTATCPHSASSTPSEGTVCHTSSSAPSWPTSSSSTAVQASFPCFHLLTLFHPPLLPSSPPLAPPFASLRNRLSYEQFSAFLANIKELNAHRQSREVRLSPTMSPPLLPHMDHTPSSPPSHGPHPLLSSPHHILSSPHHMLSSPQPLVSPTHSLLLPPCLAPPHPTHFISQRSPTTFLPVPLPLTSGFQVHALL
ncbi:unnamed protein product [Closterium sp. Naga37s-1]|nr:unnamed protein product [Closterium sp. Naga37s-1]